jgi:hypothetical protein
MCAAGAHQSGRRGTRPVAVPEQVQAGFVDRACAFGGDHAVVPLQPQGLKVGDVGPEAGAPHDDIAGLLGPVGPSDAACGEPLEHGVCVQNTTVARFADAGHHDDVAEAGGAATAPVGGVGLTVLRRHAPTVDDSALTEGE